MSEALKYYFDACVFLSLISDETSRQRTVEILLDRAEREECEIYTSLISIGEVAFGTQEKDRKVLDPKIEEKIDNLWQPPSPVKLVEVHQAVMFDARGIMRQAMVQSPRGGEPSALKPMDAIHFATARWVGATQFFTYDKKLHGYDKLVELRISEPKTDHLFDQNPADVAP